MVGLAATIPQIPLLRWMIVAAALAFAVQLLLMREAVRRRSRLWAAQRAGKAGNWKQVAATRVPRAWLESLALATLLLVPAVTVASVTSARTLARRAAVETDPATRARLVDSGLRGQLGALPFGIVLEELVGAVGVVAWGLAFAARRQMAGVRRGARIAAEDPALAEAWLRFPGPDPQTVVGCACAASAMTLLPILQGAMSYSMLLGKRLAALASAGPQMKSVDHILLEAREGLEAGASAAKLGVALAAVTCTGLLLWRSSTRLRTSMARKTEKLVVRSRARRAAAWGTGVACLAAALILDFAARPLEAENDTPWPASEGHSLHPYPIVRAPQLLGPDELPEAAPLLEVSASGARLDGGDVDAAVFRTRLAAPAEGAQAPGGAARADELVVLCGADTPGTRLAPFLEAACASGRRRAVLAFAHTETLHRPLLGEVIRTRFTGARAELAQSEQAMEPGTVMLRPERFHSCAELGARVVELRRQKARVGLLTSR